MASKKTETKEKLTTANVVEVEASETTAMVPAPQQAIDQFDYEEEDGHGWENFEETDVIIPLLKIVQPMTPQVVDRAKYPGFKGKLGDFFLNTGEIWDGIKGIELVICTYIHEFIEWAGPNIGDGFVARHAPDSEIVLEAQQRCDFGKLTHRDYPEGENRHPLVEHYNAAAILWDDEEPVIIPNKSTAITPFRRWLSSARRFKIKNPDGSKTKPSMYAHRVRMTSYQDKNEKGIYFVPAFAPAGDDIASSLVPRNTTIYAKARTVCDAIMKGRARPAYEEAAGDASFDPSKMEGSQRTSGKAAF